MIRNLILLISLFFIGIRALAQSYSYDANGNLSTDPNKKISSGTSLSRVIAQRAALLEKLLNKHAALERKKAQDRAAHQNPPVKKQ